MTDPSRRPGLFGSLEKVLLVALVAVGGALWLYQSRATTTVDPDVAAAPATSVAVLPFETPADDGGDEYFSQGLSDEIRTALARVPGLEVASRTSSHAYARDGRPIAEIAADLGVGSVLEGQVQRTDGRVRVTVSLVDVARDRYLWTETFDRTLSVEGLFAVEEEIARSVARALEVELGEESTSLAGRAPASLEAHDLYLLGLYHWNRRTGAEMLRSVQLFEEAVAADPDYALAHAGLAGARLLLPLYADARAHETMPEAKAAAREALALDSTLAEAHAVLGLALATYDFDWVAAERALRRALELNPRYATAHHWYGLLLDVRGELDRAREHHERALTLDPLSGIVNETFGNHLVFSGDFDGAIRQLRRTLEVQPDLTLALQFLAEAELLAGRWDEARATLARWAEVTGTEPAPWSVVVDAVRVAREIEGEPAGGEGGTGGAAEVAGAGDGGGGAGVVGTGEVVGVVRRLARAGTLSPYFEAQYLALAGAGPEAIDAVERGMEARDFLMFFVAADPAFDALRTDPAFRAATAELRAAAEAAEVSEASEASGAANAGGAAETGISGDAGDATETATSGDAALSHGEV